jgi:hypothetical protein
MRNPASIRRGALPAIRTLRHDIPPAVVNEELTVIDPLGPDTRTLPVLPFHASIVHIPQFTPLALFTSLLVHYTECNDLAINLGTTGI